MVISISRYSFANYTISHGTSAGSLLFTLGHVHLFLGFDCIPKEDKCLGERLSLFSVADPKKRKTTTKNSSIMQHYFLASFTCI